MRRIFHCLSLLNGISVAFLVGCKPKEYPVIVPLVLVAPVSISPSSSTALVGDTLWLEANFSDSLIDWRSGHHYRVRPQDMILDAAIAVVRLQGVGNTPIGATSAFRVVEKIGRISIGGATTGVFYPIYDGHFYRAKFGLIPTQPGVMSISLLLSPPDGASGFGRFIPFIQFPPDAQGREQKAVLDDMFFVINDGKAVNYDLYGRYATAHLQAPSGVDPKNLIYEQQSTFTVEVK